MDYNTTVAPPCQIKTGISKERVTNIEKISIIEELVKCSICTEILSKPFECESCGALFCEDCINGWMKIKVNCPSKCPELKPIKARINTRKMLNILQLKCINFPNCPFIGDYSSIIDHESACQYQKIKCPNIPCIYEGHYQMLKDHLQNDCESLHYECGFCKCKVKREDFEGHLDEHYHDKTFQNLYCSKCESCEKLRRCICKNTICSLCLYNGKNIECQQNCYVFHNGLKYTSMVYNLSKYPLPKNCEVKILFTAVEWVRTGLTFTKEIIADQNDANCPQHDVYCILEDLVQFYTKVNGWKNCFNKGGRGLKAGDYMTITLRNGELRYAINDIDLDNVIKIDMTKKKEMFLFIHVRNGKSKAELIYINEILN